MLLNLSEQSLAILIATFAVAGALVWYAGSRLAGLVDEIADRSGIGQAFAGMLLLGGITSLPEVATAGTASATGNPLLSINNLLGTSSINILLLAIGDIIYGKGPLTSKTDRPAALMQGVLGMMLMMAVAVAILIGDTAIPVIGVGVLAILLALGCLWALRISSRFEGSRRWQAVDPPTLEPVARSGRAYSNWRLGTLTTLAAMGILVGGVTLALSGEAISEKTGLGSSIVGFVLVGFGTSLPELSSILAALKLRRYQLAIGDIFGTNLFNIQIILIADVFYRDGAVLDAGGTFEVIASCIAALMTGIFVVGLLERQDKSIWRMGVDSAVAFVVFIAGLAALATTGGTGQGQGDTASNVGSGEGTGGAGNTRSQSSNASGSRSQ